MDNENSPAGRPVERSEQRLYADILTGFRPYHSEIQIDHLIVAPNGVTPYGRMKQAVRECWTRINAISGMLRPTDKPKAMSHELHLRDACRELHRFLSHAVYWHQQMPDDQTIEQREFAELFLHTQQLIIEEFLTVGTVTRATHTLVLRLPRLIRIPLINLIGNSEHVNQLANEYLNRADTESPPLLPFDEPLLLELVRHAATDQRDEQSCIEPGAPICDLLEDPPD